MGKITRTLDTPLPQVVRFYDRQQSCLTRRSQLHPNYLRMGTTHLGHTNRAISGLNHRATMAYYRAPRKIESRTIEDMAQPS
jgi:hypothetical protein